MLIVPPPDSALMVGGKPCLLVMRVMRREYLDFAVKQDLFTLPLCIFDKSVQLETDRSVTSADYDHGVEFF